MWRGAGVTAQLISPTTTVGKRAIRVMVISYLTRWEHLEELIAELRRAAEAG